MNKLLIPTWKRMGSHCDAVKIPLAISTIASIALLPFSYRFRIFLPRFRAPLAPKGCASRECNSHASERKREGHHRFESKLSLKGLQTKVRNVKNSDNIYCQLGGRVPPAARPLAGGSDIARSGRHPVSPAMSRTSLAHRGVRRRKASARRA